jgi:hypothetical protein
LNWLVTAGVGVGAGVDVPLVIGVPFPHAAKKPTAMKASTVRAVANKLFSLESKRRWISPPLLADGGSFPPLLKI